MTSQKTYRGFETWKNSFRMQLKMWLNVISFSVLIHLIFLAYIFYEFYIDLHIDDQAILKLFLVENFRSLYTSVSNLDNVNKYVFTNIYNQFRPTFYFSLLFYSLVPFIYFIFRKRTLNMFSKTHLRGSSLITEKELVDRIEATNDELRIKISHMHYLPIKYETRHTFISGTTGAGKTVLMTSVIRSLIKHKQRAVIYDAKDGEFVAKYYNPETDIIFNPFDDRSVSLNVFDYVHTQSDFDKLAKAIVPEQLGGKDPIFQNSARDILAGIFRICYQTEQTTNESVWQYLNMPIKDLRDAFRETGNERVAVLINNPSSGTAQSFMSTLMQYAKIFQFMYSVNSSTSFSIGDWLRSPDSRFLFLPNNVKQKDSLAGIFSLFFNLISNEILSLRDNPDYRIFMLMDEFGTLKKMDSIKDLLTLGRSKGACCFLGIQEKSQIDNVYGSDVAKTLINQCNIKIVFRLNESDTMEYFSKNIGENETERMEESYSAGVEDNKDGENYRKVMKKERLVLPAELGQLPDLHYYLKLPNKAYCLTRIEYQKDQDLQPSFVENKGYSLDNLPKFKKRDPNSDSDNEVDDGTTLSTEAKTKNEKSEASKISDSKKIEKDFFAQPELEDDSTSIEMDDL
jgi:type IV secretory pathway TraG/TraD family ATPase VirD4